MGPKNESLCRQLVAIRSWSLGLTVLSIVLNMTYDGLQVSTKTGVKSHYFNLHVLVPTAFILGNDEYHTQAGNAISLVCIIENVSSRPETLCTGVPLSILG